VASIAIMYLMIWRPQQKRLAEDKAFRDGLKVDDKVVTAGGMFGKITLIETDRVQMEIASKTRVFVRKAQVAALDEPAPSAEAEKK
jgi:preprotein translocase subunit YajC